MSTRRIRTVALVVAALAAPALAQCMDDETLTADPPAAGEQFGTSVAMDGQWLAVGAPESAIAGDGAGAVHVFMRDAGDWMFRETITSDDAESFDDFGRSVALDGDTLVVGAPGKDVVADNDGAAYVFRLEGQAWVQEQRLNHADPHAGDRFGWSVGVEGDVSVVGAFGVDLAENSAGAVYVFRFDGEAWGSEGVLVAEDAAALAQLGRSVAIDSQRIVAGAWQDDDAGFFTGSAYTFVREAEAWVQEQKLVAEDAGAFAYFGIDVDLEGPVALVGAYGDAEAGGLDAGAAYVFARSGGAWSQQDKLIADDGAEGSRFGWSVALDGVDAWVGAQFESAEGAEAGAAYLFRAFGADWNQVLKRSGSDGGPGAELGTSIDASGGRAAAGAAFWDVGDEADAGAAVALAECVCPADFNADGALDVLDFVAFQQAWVLGNAGADCNDDGEFNVIDFVCYQLVFVAGCP